MYDSFWFCLRVREHFYLHRRGNTKLGKRWRNQSEWFCSSCLGYDFYKLIAVMKAAKPVAAAMCFDDDLGVSSFYTMHAPLTIVWQSSGATGLVEIVLVTSTNVDPSRWIFGQLDRSRLERHMCLDYCPVFLLNRLFRQRGGLHNETGQHQNAKHASAHA